MKKLLLSFVMILSFAAMAYADVVTWDFVNNDYGLERQSGNSTKYLPSETVITNGDSQIELTKGGGNGFRLWADGIRFMKVTEANWAKMAVRIPGGKISKVILTYKSGNGVFGCTLDNLNDEYDYDNATKATEAVWTGLTLFPEEVVFQSLATGTKALSKIEVTYTKETDLDMPGLKFPTSSYEVYLNETFDAPQLTNPNNLPVSYTSSNESVATVAADGSVTLLSAGSTTITVSSEQTDKFLAGSASYTLTVKEPAASYNTLAEFIAGIPEKGDAAVMNGDLTVVYVNGAYVYVKDETASSLIYKYGSGYQKGDVIPGGWEGENAVFNGLFEIAPTGEMPVATSTVDVTYPAFTGALTMDMVNQVVTLKNVTIEEATPSDKSNFNVTVGGETVQFRNNFSLEAVEPGVYDIDVAVSAYNTALQVYPIAYNEPAKAELTYRRKYTDSSSRYYTEISYTVNDNNTVVYSTSDPSQEPYYVTPVNGSWQTEGAYIDMTDKVIEVPVNAESFTMILKSTFGATHWSQNAIFVDWNNNGSFVDAGETNGVINISNKPNTAEGGLVAKGGETDEIALPEGLKAGDTFTLLIAMNEPKGVDGTQDLWGTDWEWTTEIFNGDVCSLINGQAYALTVKITEKSAPTVVSTKDYVGRLTVQIGEDGEATEVENTTIHFSTMSDGTYSLLLEKFGADPSDPTSNGLGDIQIDGITRNGNNLNGFAPMLELMNGTIKANATLTGEFEGEDITLHLDVNWLGEDGVTVLAPIYVDFTTKPKEVTVVSTKDYTGTLAIQIGEDSEATDRENTTIHFSTMSDGTYSLLLEKFGADPSDPTSNGLGDIQIDGITRNGNNLNGFAPMLELMNGTIKANATLTGEFEGEDITLHLDVNWLGEDGVTVLAPIYVDFTTIKNPSAIDSIDADNNAPVEYYTIQGVRVSGDNLTPGIYIRRQGSNVSKILVK